MERFENVRPYKADIAPIDIDRSTAHEIGQYFPNGIDMSILASPDFNEIMNAVQPWEDKLGIAVNNFTVNAIGMGSMMASTLFDIPEIINAVSSANREYGNDLYHWGKDYMADNLKTIYEKDPGSFNPTDSSWWFNRLGDAGSVAGIAGETVLEGTALSLLTEGAGNIAQAANLGKRLSMIPKITSLISKANKERLVYSGAFGYSGVREALLESNDVYEQVLNNQLQAGIPEEQAKLAAASAATIDFRANALIKGTMGVIQSRIMTYSPLKGLSENTMLDNTLGKINNKFLRGAAKTGIESGLESGEEAYQAFISQYSSFYADRQSNLTNQYELNSYIDKAEILNNAFVGLLGSAGMQSTYGTINGTLKKLGLRSDNPFETAYEEAVKKGNGITVKAMEEISEAIQNGDEKKINEIRKSLNSSLALNALWLDYLNNGEERLFGDYTSYLDNTLRAIENNDLEQLQKLGIKEDTDIENLKTNFLKYKNDAQKIKTAFLEEAEYASPHSIIEQTMLNVDIASMEEAAVDLEKDIASYLPNRYKTGFKGNGKVKVELRTESRANKKAIKQLEKLRADASSKEEKDSYRQRIKDLESRIVAIEDQLKELDSDSREDSNFNAELVKNGKLIFNEYEKLVTSKIVNEKVKQTMIEELNRWRDKKIQSARVKEMFNGKVENAKSKEDINNIEKEVDEAVENNVVNKKDNEDITSNIKAKKDKITRDEKSTVKKTTVKKAKVTPEVAKQKDKVNNFIKSAEVDEEYLLSLYDDKLISKDKKVNIDNIGDEGFATDVLSEFFNKVKNEDGEDFYPGDTVKYAREKLNSMAEDVLDMAKNVGKYPHIELFLEYLSISGQPKMKSIFHVIRLGWDENVKKGLLPEVKDWDDIYNRYFNVQDFYERMNKYAQSEPLSEKEIKETEKEVITDEKIAQNNNVEDTIAFTNFRMKQVRVENEDGSIKHKWVKEDQANFFDSQYAPKSKELGNPYEYNVGTKLLASIPSNYKEIPHTLRYNDETDPARFGDTVKVIKYKKNDVTKEGTPTFGDYMEGITIYYEDPITNEVSSAFKKIEEDSEEYWNSVTITLYKEGGTPEKDGIGYLHNSTWYNKPNIKRTEEARKLAKAANSKNRSYAKEAIKKGEAAKFVINYRGKGDYSQTRMDEFRPLSEVSPSSELLINFASKGLSILTKGKNFRNFTSFYSFNKQLDSPSFQPSNITDIRLTNVIEEDGETIEVYTPFYVVPSKLDDKEVESITNAIYMYLNPNSERNKKLRALVKSKRDVNFKTFFSMSNYVNMFINTKHTKNFESTVLLNEADGTVTLTDPETGDKTIYEKDSEVLIDDIYKAVNAQRGNRKVDASSLTFNSDVYYLTNDITVEETNMQYEDYIKTRLLTNQRSLNVGTEENPFWTPTIQPVLAIQPDLANDVVKPKPISEILTKKVEDAKEGIEASKVLEEVKSDKKEYEKLANDVITFLSDIISNDEKKAFDKNTLYTEDNDYSVDITKEIIEEFRRHENLIDHLLSTEQEELIEVLFFHINASLMSLEKLSRDDVKQITLAFIEKEIVESLLPSINKYTELVESIPEEYNNKELLHDLQLAKNKIESISDNIDLLSDLVYDSLVEYNVALDQDEDVLGNAAFDKTHNEFSNKEQASDAIRKFMFSLYDIDSNGNIKTGFLHLTKFVDKDKAFDDVTSIMADIDSGSSYEGAIEHLKSYHNAYPWIWYEPEASSKETQEEIEVKQNNTLVGRLGKRSLKDGKLSSIQHQFMYIMNRHHINSSLIIPRFSRNELDLKRHDVQTNTTTRNIINDWHNNLKTSDLLEFSNREYRFIRDKAKELLDEYNEMFNKQSRITTIDENKYPNLVANLAEKKSLLFSKVRYNKEDIDIEKVFSNNRKLKDELKKLKGDTLVTAGNIKYVLRKIDNDIIQVFPYGKTYGITDEEISKWTEKVGITLSPKHIEELRKGITKYKKVKGKKAKGQTFYLDSMLDYNEKQNTSTGILGHIALQLAKIVNSKEQLTFGTGKDINFNDNNFIEAAKRESKYSTHINVTSYRDGNKNLYAYTAPNYMTDRVNRLKNGSDIPMLKKSTFSKDSFVLDLLNRDSEFRNIFSSEMIPKTVIKQFGKRVFGDNTITKLSEADHELTKIGHFQDITRTAFRASIEMGENKIPVKARIASFFGLTMSDKSAMEVFNTIAIDMFTSDFDTTIKDISVKDHIIDFLYEQTVLPEIDRVIEYTLYNKSDKYNIKGYVGNMIYLYPSLNKLKVKDTDIITRLTSINSEEEIDSIKDEIKPIIKKKLSQIIDSKINAKVDKWKTLGIISISDEKSKVLFDRKYIEKFNEFKNKSKNQFYYAVAADFEINYLLHNAEMYKLFAGDPAIYHKIDDKEVKSKFKSDFENMNDLDFLKASKDTFVNIGKRLALLQAPGYKLSDTENEKYIQLMLDDNEAQAAAYEYIQSKYGDEIAQHFMSANETDAQEYTTWKEHLHILERIGRMPDYEDDITPEDIRRVRHIVKTGKKDYEELSLEDKQLMTKVFQPIKPVYTGQYFDETHNVMRTVYVKSSSFPLLEMFTHNLEIDKLRVLMEKIQDERGMNVRASYQSANKVGAVNNPLKIINDTDYRMIDYSNNMDDVINNSSIVLNRRDFKIQQDVPYKSAKGKHEITQGTQLAKELYGDGVLSLIDFEDGKTGVEMWEEYQDIYNDIMNTRIDILKSKFSSIEKVQELLYEEASKRGYSKQTRHYLELDTNNGYFKNPIIFAPDAYKLENLLQAIINKHIIKIKMPGYSFVAGSEAGIMSKTIDELDKKTVSDIVWIDKPLDRKLLPNELLIPSKILHPKTGELIDLLASKKDGKPYAYQIEDKETGVSYWQLNKDIIDEDLLQVISFRIPTSKHSSMSLDKIVGFLPVECGDLMIVSSSKTIMKGLDFDVDKENTYNFFMGEKDGKIVPLHKQFSIEEVDKLINETKDEKEKERLLELKYKLLRNKLVDNTRRVLVHPKVEEKTMMVLSTTYAENEANALDSILSTDDPNFTPLSTEYQKAKMILGSSNKLGTGAYSLDVVFHSLAQQAKLSGNVPVSLSLPVKFGSFKEVKEFGNIMSADGNRSITEVVSEAQNFAVDGEKLQVMGKVNINDYTLDVDKVFRLLGIDKGDEVEYEGKKLSHTPFLFLSQPIIRDYVAIMKKLDSQISEFSINKEKTAIEELEKIYNLPPNFYSMTFELDRFAPHMKSFTNQNLLDQLTKEKDFYFQSNVLEAFIYLKNIGKEIRTIQTTINVDSKGLGKSLFDTLDIEKNLDSLSDLKYVLNAESLLEYRDKYTAQGIIIKSAIEASLNNWLPYFPYRSEFFLSMFDNLRDIFYPENDDKYISTDKKQTITNELKKFLFTHSNNNLFRTSDLQAERERLMLDTKYKKSLARYLKDLLKEESHSVINNNKLIANGLTFNIERNGSFSRINYNNAVGKTFSETTMQSSIIALLTNRIDLPNFNEEPYDTIQLAKDLVAYAYLEGGVQEAREFVKFIPYAYLEKIGFSKNMNILYELLFNNSISSNKKILDNFILQFVRHNPSMLSKLKEYDITKEGKIYTKSDTLLTNKINLLKKKGYIKIDNKDLLEFYGKGKYFAIYDKSLSLEDSKYLIVKVNTENETLELINQLGDNGISEYDFNSNGMHESVARKYRSDLGMFDNVDEGYELDEKSGIMFKEDDDKNYKSRTKQNAASADVTIAIAADFTTTSEQQTKDAVFEAKRKYIDVNGKILKASQERIDNIVEVLNTIETPDNSISINIAGNSISTYDKKFKVKQKELDDFVYELLKGVIESPNLKVSVESIRSGGQTGIDEAGVKAGIKLGIPTKILAPKDWRMRLVGKEVYNEQLFKGRFAIKDETKPIKESVSLINSLDEYKNLVGSGKLVETLEKLSKDNRVSKPIRMLLDKFSVVESKNKLVKKLIVDNTRNGASYYNHTTGILGIEHGMFEIHALNSLDLTLENHLGRRLAHEYLHAMSTVEINKYITDKVYPKVSKDAPQYIKNLVDLFYEARKYTADNIIKSIDEKIKKLNKGENAELTPEELKDYGLYSINEFVSEIGTNREFMMRMNEKPEKAKTFREKVYKFFSSVLEAFGIKVNKDSILERAMIEITDLMNDQFYKSNESNNKAEKLNINDKDYSPNNIENEINQLVSTWRDADGDPIC